MKKLLKKTILESGLETGGNEIVTFSFVGKRTISRINEEFVGHEGVTDVISFSYDEEASAFPGEEDVAAEIIVCVDKADEESRKRKNMSFTEELVLYIVHGVLHIAGEDDINPTDRKKMRRREREVMKKLKEEIDFSELFDGGV